MNREQGLVILTAVINEQGRIENLQVVEAPSGSPGDAAAAAVRTWKYEPYLRNGAATKVETKINVVYRLGGKQKPHSKWGFCFHRRERARLHGKCLDEVEAGEKEADFEGGGVFGV